LPDGLRRSFVKPLPESARKIVDWVVRTALIGACSMSGAVEGSLSSGHGNLGGDVMGWRLMAQPLL